MKKSLTMEIAEIERELTNLNQAYQEAENDWRAADVEYLKAKRLADELYAHKRDLKHEIDCRMKRLKTLQAEVQQPAIA
ncbi:hypothetical protein M4D57_18860 [Brevibacillus borstelensis]|jgi:chromosome segregation ATPase|uniref:hypothetical protein n=1 Tax=Brevibacillus borstelensis TaxID=45462 RepID=UPI00057BECAA|nr:hypothetical protein [Brevibacillus borstelensis]MCM3560629.1 hypothetical protein [Brevibacillus borstelensis]